jgi:hypothetical protein
MVKEFKPNSGLFARLCHATSIKQAHLKCLYLNHNIYTRIKELNTMIKEFKLSGSCTLGTVSSQLWPIILYTTGSL